MFRFLSFFALLAIVCAEDRKVSITGRLGCINPAGKWIPMPEAIVTLWEEDWGPFESHDELSKTTVDAQGKFSLSGSESESGKVRFFISVHVLCNGVKMGAWNGGPCKDKVLEERCKPQDVTGGKSMKTGDAWFNHLFEYNPDGEEHVKEKYHLDCVIGFKSDKGTMDGLTCGEKFPVCNGGRCGHERSMGALTHTRPGGK